jgi:SAM-dependent methyltransferase
MTSPLPLTNPSSFPTDFGQHLKQGTAYDTDSARAYAKERGIELHYFLDLSIYKVLDRLRGAKMLDLGCGAAPHSIYAARRGADVEAFDIQPQMISAAQRAILNAGLQHKILAAVMESSLIHDKPRYDHAISINVGCNLPQNIFSQHFSEIAKVLKTGGTATVSAPYSLDVVFTNGKIDDDQALKQINGVLSNLPRDPSPQEIKEALINLPDILSATFAIINDQLILVRPGMSLAKGQPIWRKLPNCVIPNFYHEDSEYQEVLSRLGMKIVSVEKRVLKAGKENLSGYALGSAYYKSPPFIIYHIQKA